MLCDKCGKKPANIHVAKIIDGHKQEFKLCSECAHKDPEIGLHFNMGQHQFGFFDLLSGLLSSDVAQPPAFHYHQPIECEQCNYSYHQFQHTGKLSCGNCYNSFDQQLEGLLRRIHGSNRHIGKLPARAGGALKMHKDLQVLKEKLKLAVGKEAFEEAAVLRDNIKELEKHLKKEG